MTRRYAPVSQPVVCTIAGSDSGGGAGIQADLKTIEAGGGFGTSVVTSVTAQNTTGVESTHVLPVPEVRAQADAVFDDLAVDAVKTGMLATEPVVSLVAERIGSFDGPAVVDPVMVAASGDRLLEPEAETAYEQLIAEATVVTPNVDEAAVLTDRDVTGPGDAAAAGEDLVAMGAEAALVKGGHLDGDAVVDTLVTADGVERVRHARVDTDATHGSGCALSSAVATRLAHGEDLSAAVRAGVDRLARAVRYGIDAGAGPGAVHHTVALRDRAERQPTAERVAELARRVTAADVEALLPGSGMALVGATPYAETPAECAAVDGGVVDTQGGPTPVGDVRFGAAPGATAVLLGAREVDADLRFLARCRGDDAVTAALDRFDGAVAAYDPPAGASRDRGAVVGRVRQAVEGVEGTPVAVHEPAATGREPTVSLLAAGSARLADRLLSLADAL